MINDLWSNLGLGLVEALSLTNLFYCFLGVFLGTLLGVIPGVGVLVSISLLYPITFHIDPTASLIMLAGIYYGTTYGGSTSSILLNLPGTPANAVACIDGYPMAQKGRAGSALVMSSVACFVGGSVGIVLLSLFGPLIATNAYNFGPKEYFGLILLGLVAASTISSTTISKGLAMICAGILFGTVGADSFTGIARMTFGSQHLYDGIDIIVLAMGVFGVSEIMASAGGGRAAPQIDERINLRALLPSREEVSRSVMPMIRGAGIGSFLGTLPGGGGTIASFMSYAVERGVTRRPEEFGKGAIEGLVGPETSNNAADQTAFIPTLALGIPGTASMAIMLSILVIHGITPGPRLMMTEPQLFWGLIMSFWIGNLMLLVLNIPFVGIWVRLLTIPYHYLYPAVLIFIAVGIYSVDNDTFGIYLVGMFAVIGYFMRAYGYSPAPLLLGFVLGPMLEQNFRRAMLIARGDLTTFFDGWLSGLIMAIPIALLIWRFVVWALSRRRKQMELAAKLDLIDE